ncbi:amino acid/amide ABC transporter substrate-binding protein (HAAT family) [Archangium gephyra]|uniref:Amino acid/amide ABC transporter substrate-binding protein (HAAT family) n=1 Tax=Archangium gephyra TaxID=48 RepID=A0AAC8TCI0_9BACT|nr:ABC transporter substrate-binding protein [Archangium gephyra]AKJ00762.1 Branched-chain amino acid ABC transporter, amino acid-binding protein [Archangium gephyra]REG25924.1 amino acid/amide ABC transporter substrate-binding protein (HAAT family) [Archangium gephyra]
MRRSAVPMLLAALTVLVAACEKKVPPAPSSQPAPAPAAASAEAPPANTDTILLGQVGSLTGSEATFGVSARNGIAMAVAEANAAGGVKGKKLEVRVYDSQGRPEEAAQAATRLITQDKVAVILGEAASTNSMAMADKAQAAGVPMITPTSTNPAVTRKGDYIFRVCFIDPFQGYVMAKFARDHLKLNRVAVLQDNKSAYSVGLTDVFSRKFSEMGGAIVANESYAKGDTDFRAQLTAFKQARPEALFVPGYYTDVGIIARQARELGLSVPLLGGDGWESDKLFELGGTALEGSYYSNHYSVDNPDPRVQQFITKYKAAHGAVPDSVAALAYDAAALAIDAMKRAPDLSGAAIRDALAATRDFPGVGGTINIDKNRDAVKQAVILKVEGGKTKFVTTVKP